MAVTHGLDRLQSAGDAVVVLGAGSLGLMHVAKAELLGAGTVIAIDVLRGRLEHARRFGADLVLAASETTRSASRASARRRRGAAPTSWSTARAVRSRSPRRSSSSAREER
jgi:threonine dehydrogenase-like Zn-dependent dehydrogenase